MRFRNPILLRLAFTALAFVLTGAATHATANLSEGKLEISSNWAIRVPGSADQVVVRAARDLQSFLTRRHALELRIVKDLGGPGLVLELEENSDQDRFLVEAVPSRNQVRVAGSSSRSVFQGVLYLQDSLAAESALPVAFQKSVVFPFQDRYVLWDSLLTGQNKGAVAFDLERHLREAVRLGYSGIECNRFVGMTLLQQGDPGDPYPWYTYWGPSMDQFVVSRLFEGVFPADYLQRNLADLKHIAELAASFGLKPIFMSYEPRFVPEEFFKQRPELRGPRVDHPLRSIARRYSLCTDRPEVLEHYRSLARRLAEEVPVLREMWVIFHDSGAGLCWSNSLYSGRNGPEYCRDIPMGERMRKFFLSIKEGLREGGLDIPLVAQPHPMSRGEIDEFFASVPREIGLTSGNWASWSLIHHDPLSVDRYVLSRLKETGRRALYYQQHFFGFNGAPTSEFPIPYVLAARLKRAQQMGLAALNTLGGFVSPPIKERSVMQELYRRFLLEPSLSEDSLVEKVANELGGDLGGSQLIAIWKRIHAAFKENRRDIGFGLGTEYASRRTLVRPLVPEASALAPEERDWWLDYTFGGHLRFGHAHLFRSEEGRLSQEWYQTRIERTRRARDAFQEGATRLRSFLRRYPELGRSYPYLASHQRQLSFLGKVYATGANLYEGQRILDKYSKKNIWDELKTEVEADAVRFENVVRAEISNTKSFLGFIEEAGDIGMVLLPQETTWGYGTNLPELLRLKIETMQRHLPEVREVLNRWFDSEY